MIYIGIDPGANGGIAMIRPLWDPTVYEVCKYTDEMLIKILRIQTNYEERKVFVEQQGVRNNNSKKSAFGTGRNYGKILGILKCFNIDPVIVPPATWKKEIGVTKDKQSSINMCKKLFPFIDLQPGKCTTDQDGIAEALLIAEYGRRLDSEKISKV